MTNFSDIFIPTWSPGVVGFLETTWYTSSLCDSASKLRTTTYIAYSDSRVSTSRTCEEARRNLRIYLGPTHSTEWGCLYSESHKGWFRDKCHVEAALEKVVRFWGTPGGVFLIMFISLVCCFIIWWVSLCYRARKMVNICDGLREIDLDTRLQYAARYNNKKGAKKVWQNDNDDDELIFNSDNNNARTRVNVGNLRRDDDENV